MFYVLGDIHGDIVSLRSLAEQCSAIASENGYSDDDNTYVMLGDVGIAYGGRAPKKNLLKAMENIPGTFLILRGNHDDRYCKDLQHFPYMDMVSGEYCGMQVKWSNHYPSVKFLRDEGGMLDISGHKCLVAPGAWSIDKNYRLAYGYPWCPEEELTYAELSDLINIAHNENVEYVFSHTAPVSWMRNQLTPLLFSGVDDTGHDGMEKAFEQILYEAGDTLKCWCFGHFHGDMIISENGKKIGALLYNKPIALPELSGVECSSEYIVSN